MQSDSVARFMDDKILDGILALGQDLAVRASELYGMYVEWARQSGEKNLGNRRFVNRMMSNFPSLEHTKAAGHTVWRGLGRHPSAGVLGILGS